MQIVNQKVQKDIDSGVKIKINLGCGTGNKEGFYGLDFIDSPNVDIVANLNEPLDLIPDNSVDEIWSCHVLEHIDNTISLMEELYRIASPEAKITIIVPHFSNPYYYSDPTHTTFFGLYSMYYFTSEDKQPLLRKVPSFYTKCRFIVKEIKIHLLDRKLIDRIIFPRMFNFINKNIKRQDFYERRLCRLFPAGQIVYNLNPDK